MGKNGGMSFGSAFDRDTRFRVCFVCTGNICRSPMAEAVFRDLAQRSGLEHRVAVISAGTDDWHVGEPCDSRARDALAERGLDGARHRAKQFDPDWFDHLDLVVVCDRVQERLVKAWARDDADRAKVHLLLSFDREHAGAPDVPDPYYSDPAMFAIVLAMIERAGTALFRQIEPALQKAAR